MNDRVAGALHRLALEGGSVTAASKALDIPKQTLWRWKNDYREEYERIREAHEERRDRELADEYHGIARDRAKILEQIGSKSLEALEEDDLKALQALAGADKAFATSAGILTQNDRSLRDKPLFVSEQKINLAELEGAIKTLHEEGMRLARLKDSVETTGEELEPDELPPAA